jgi:hypothetical protein
LSIAVIVGVATTATISSATAAGASLADFQGSAPLNATSSAPVSAPFDASKFNSGADLARCGGSGGYWNWYYCNDPAVVGCPKFPDGTCGEFGVDIPLPAGTTIRAPEAGTISKNGPCAPPDYACWVPGRVVLTADSGDPYPGVMGFGHVDFVVTSGHVSAGQEIATVADQTPLHTNWVDHVEFMYSPSGGMTHAAFTGCSKPADPCGEAPSNPSSPWTVLVALEKGGGAGILDFIKTQNTTSGRVELFEIPGPNYKAAPTVATPTWFSAADWDNGAFQMDGSSLVFIKYVNTGSGKVELFEIRGPNYNSAPAVATPTWFSPSDAFNGWWQMEGTTLWFIKVLNTASGHVELFGIPGPNYTSAPTVATTTSFSSADAYNGVFQMVGSTLAFIKTRNTGSGTVELFEVPGPNYKAPPTVSTPTWFSPADANNGSFQMDGSTLAFIKTFNTASGTVELFERPAPYTPAPTVATATGFNSHDGGNGWFQLDGK